MSMEIDNVSYILLVIFSGLAGICSLFTLVLIYKMKKFNNYILIVTCLTVSQAIYDFSTIVVPCINCSSFAITFFRCFAGLVTTLWTNAIMLLVYYVVKTSKTLDLKTYFPYCFAGINLYGLILGVIIAESFDKDPTSATFINSSGTYYWTRIVSVIINIIVYIYLQVLMNRRRWQIINGSIAYVTDEQKDPISALVNRMKFYPLVQIICRGAATWFEMQYGFSTYNYIESASLSYRAADIIYVITLPSAGIGFFFIFLINTPGTLQYVVDGFHYYTCYFFSSTRESELPLLTSASVNSLKMRDTTTVRELDPAALDEQEICNLIAVYHQQGQSIIMSSVSTSQNASFTSNSNNNNSNKTSFKDSTAATLTSAGAARTSNKSEINPSLTSINPGSIVFNNSVGSEFDTHSYNNEDDGNPFNSCNNSFIYNPDL